MQPTTGPELNPLSAILGYLAIMLISGFLFYLYFAITLMIIARKSKTPNAWLAWLPLGNLFLMCSIGRRSGGWVLLLLVPLVNIFAMAIIWMSIAEARGKPAWTGALVLVPFGGLAVPVYMATGRTTQPDLASGPRVCPNCSVRADHVNMICANCGVPLPAPARAEPKPIGKLVPVAITATLAIAMLNLGMAWYLFFREIPYTPPVREEPELPERAQGTITEFPVDTDANAPARPSSVITQDFERPASGGSTAKVQVPEEWMPPGVRPDSLPRRASGMTSATYRARPAGASSTRPARQSGRVTEDDVPIYIHVLNTPSATSRTGDEITGEVARSTKGTRTGARVDSPVGAIYTGSKIQTPEILIYVLSKQNANIVIIIYAPRPEAQSVAERLAGNVGNGRGLNDYPEVRDSLWTLPATPPDGLVLEEINSFTRYEMESSLSQAQSGARGEGGDEVREVIAQIRQFIPEVVIAARYSDSSNREWGVVECDFGSTRRASNLWMLLRWTIGMSGMRSVDVRGESGLYADQGGERLLIFQKGPYLIFLVGPTAAPVEKITALANRCQV